LSTLITVRLHMLWFIAVSAGSSGNTSRRPCIPFPWMVTWLFCACWK